MKKYAETWPNLSFSFFTEQPTYFVQHDDERQTVLKFAWMSSVLIFIVSPCKKGLNDTSCELFHPISCIVALGLAHFAAHIGGANTLNYI